MLAKQREHYGNRKWHGIFKAPYPQHTIQAQQEFAENAINCPTPDLLDCHIHPILPLPFISVC